MANGTPSNTIPLGSALLEAMGDAKGAMKALGDEAKNAKADARSAQNDLKQAERDAKKAQAAIDKIKGKGGTVTQDQKTEAKRLNNLVDNASKKAMEKQTIVTEKNVKREGLKAQQKVERDRIKNMNQFEKRINGKITGVRDTLHGVGARLSNSNVPALKKAGQSISEAATSLTPESVSSLVKIGGHVLRGAAIGGTVAGVAVGAVKLVDRYNTRNVEESKTRARISDSTTAVMKSFAGKTVSGADADLMSSGLKSQGDMARKQISDENILTKVIGTTGVLAEFFGTSSSVAKREEALGKAFLSNKQVSERFGADVADKLDLEKLGDSFQIKKQLEKNIAADMSAGGLTRRLLELNSTTRDAAKLYYATQDKKALNLLAIKERENRIKNIQAELAFDKKRVLEDPDGASKRKQSAIRDQSIESERIRRNMQTARF